jgi:hypothetical protein
MGSDEEIVSVERGHGRSAASSRQAGEKDVSAWRWWEEPMLRFRKVVGTAISTDDPLLINHAVEVREILVKRELWFNPQEGVVKNSVRGVPGAHFVGESDGFIFPVWRCQSCNKVLIVGEFSDLRHECMTR